MLFPPAGRLLVDITTDSPRGTLVSSTMVTITYDEEAETKEYRVGNSGWVSYTGPFIVSENTVIEARAIKKENVYDENGSLLLTRDIGGRDLLYVGNIGIEEFELDAPTITRLEPITENEVARVRITYPDNSLDKVFKKNYGIEQIYSDEISIEKYGTHIIAYYYDNTGKRSKSVSIIINDTSTEPATPSVPYNPIQQINTGGGGSPNNTPNPIRGVDYPESSVPALTISLNPTTITDSVEVSVDAPGTADKVYLKLGRYGRYQEYVMPLTVRQNMEVSAYYITYNGFNSDTGYKVVNNIKVDNKPYVKIDANPYPYSGRYGDSSVEITITGSDYDTLEYSENGVVFQEYTESFTLTENKRIYAKATNDHGVTESYLDITNIGKLEAPTPMKKLDVSITVQPEPSISTERYTEATVAIDYDSRATGKYYRIGKNGILQPYTEEFTITENTTIYAYALMEGGRGESSKLVDHLSSGISEPTISVQPRNVQASKVTVFIDYDKYATVKRYSINGGSLRDYSGYFEITENETIIRAFSINDLGEESESTYMIRNIIPEPPVLLVNQGDYYILKLNYPPNSTDQEYKFKENGDWKDYKPAGIMLIKPNKKDQVIQGGTLVQIRDENNNLVTFTGDYYLIDVPISEIMENIFMRWDKETPQPPNIILSTEDPARELNVLINYDSSILKKEYKIIRPGGSSTGWLEYDGLIPVSEKNIIVYARGMNSTEVWSNYTSAITLTSYQVLQGGWKNSDGTVTIYAKGKDVANNETIVTKKVLSLDLDMPMTPVINSNYGYPILTSYGVEFDGRTTINFDNRPGIINEYSLDNGTTWLPYTGEFTTTAGTVRARSTKVSSGLQVSTSKTISMPSDALPASVVDGSNSTGHKTASDSDRRLIQIDPSVQGKGIYVYWMGGKNSAGSAQTSYLRFLNENKATISSVSRTSGSAGGSTHTVPVGTKWIRFDGYYSTIAWTNGTGTLYEIRVTN